MNELMKKEWIKNRPKSLFKKYNDDFQEIVTT